jgi:hypothetical protein
VNVFSWMLAMVLLGGAVPSPASTGAPAHEYKVSGVAVSSRDGAPVPYCRITAEPVPPSQIGTARSQDMSGPRSDGGPVRSGRPSGGQGGGRFQGGPRGGGGTGNQPLEATADGSGHFTLDLPRAGAWRLMGTARGFRGQNYDEHDGFYSAVVLTESSPSYTLTFKLTPDSVLDGQIFDEAGEPVAQAQVWAELVPPKTPGAAAEAERPRLAGAGQTDDLGRYEIGGLAPGDYRVKVQAQPWYARGRGGLEQQRSAGISAGSPASLDPSLDLVYPVTWFPGTDDELAAQVIALAPGEERQADFQMTAVPSVHLRIPRVDAGDTEPANRRGGVPQQRPAFISRVSSDSGGFDQMTQATGNENEWDFSGLTPGTYQVRLPGPDGRPDGDVRQLEVRAGSLPVLTLEGARPLIPVTVKLEEFAQSQVEFVNTETGQRYPSTPQFAGRRGFGRDDGDAADAAARTVMLPAHQYDVFVTGGSGVFLTGISAKGAKVLGRRVTIDGEATLTLHVANGHAEVEGVARLPSGKAAQGAMVLLVPATQGEPGDLSSIERDETNTDGTFLIGSVVPGRYILVAIDHGWNVKWRDPATLGPYLLRGVPVDLRTTSKVHEELEATEP